MTVTNPALPLSAAEIERTLRAAGAGHDAARRGVHGPRRSSSGNAPTSSAAAGSARGTSTRSRERGQYLTLDVGGESVLVIGDDDGLPRAFLNTCRHRGARLVDRRPRARCGACSARTTPGPTGFDGALRNAPFTDGLEDFDPACFALHAVRLAVVEGLVLLDLSGEAPPPQEHVGDLAAAARRLPARRAAARRADRLRRRRELEGDRRELQRVPALPGRAPGAQPALALPVAARRSRAPGCGAAAR